MAIGNAAQRLVGLRDRWLNPPEWVACVGEPTPGFLRRPVARDEATPNGARARCTHDRVSRVNPCADGGALVQHHSRLPVEASATGRSSRRPTARASPYRLHRPREGRRQIPSPSCFRPDAQDARCRVYRTALAPVETVHHRGGCRDRGVLLPQSVLRPATLLVKRGHPTRLTHR